MIKTPIIAVQELIRRQPHRRRLNKVMPWLLDIDRGTKVTFPRTTAPDWEIDPFWWIDVPDVLTHDAETFFRTMPEEIVKDLCDFIDGRWERE